MNRINRLQVDIRRKMKFYLPLVIFLHDGSRQVRPSDLGPDVGFCKLSGNMKLQLNLDIS